MKDDEPRIHIEGLEVLARVGVTESERAQAQRLALNITLWITRSFAELQDDIGSTANYSAIAAEARAIAEAQPMKLIETMADKIAARMVGMAAIRSARVEVRKFVLPGCEYVSVTAIRKRND